MSVYNIHDPPPRPEDLDAVDGILESEEGHFPASDGSFWSDFDLLSEDLVAGLGTASLLAAALLHKMPPPAPMLPCTAEQQAGQNLKDLGNLNKTMAGAA